MAAGVSTSGLFLKHAGRVGDSPIIGSGFYSDAMAGSAAATGLGEDIMRGCLSIRVVDQMRLRCGSPGCFDSGLGCTYAAYEASRKSL